MARQTSQTQSLVDVAADTFVDEIMPALPDEKRYTAAMVANALSIARRRLSHDDPALPLLDAFEANDLDALATAFRAGDVGGEPEPKIREKLLYYLEAELAITNPNFLERRKGKPK
ncbi:MAG: DUF6285 domain-containing protein [Pseudomonadota bacterium]